MSNTNESTVAPNSIEAQALAELQKEGETVETSQPNPDDGEIKDLPTPPKEEVKKEETPKEVQPERTPSMVEAWKLKVAEDQKEAALAAKAELEQKLEEMSKQRDPITPEQKQEVVDDIEEMAKEAGVDASFLKKFADSIIKKAKPSDDIEQTIQSYKEKEELNNQLNGYNQEFEKDVLPLLKDYDLSEPALSQVKNQLKDFAFSETYAKVPLKEIFRIKEEALEIKTPKRSSEGKGIKTRANEVVDLDNLDEDAFNKLTPEQIEEFSSRKTGVWNTPKGRF